MSYKLKSYVEAREWLESFIPKVYGKQELGLRRIENLLSKLGNPEKKFKSVHVAGTAGKGSTAFNIARLLQFSEDSDKSESQKTRINQKVRRSDVFENLKIRKSEYSEFSGLKIGLHVSPHLVYIGERMQINGKPIPVKRLIGLVNEIKPVVEAIIANQPEITPSYFEILVALSFLYFAEEKVDIAVVEVGLGGRLDATNVLMSEISVITNIGLDHTELLGDTVEKIAKEKAGIIKRKGPEGSKGTKGSKGTLTITGATGKALKVIEKVAKEKNATLININTLSENNRPKTDIERSITRQYYTLRSMGTGFAVLNKNLALLAVLALKINIDKVGVSRAFSADFVGRFEQMDDGVIVDGAHNAEKIRSLIEFVRNTKYEIRNTKITLVLAFKKGKNWKEMIDMILKNLPITTVIATQYFATTDMGKGSAVAAEEIANYLTKDKRLTTKVIKNSQEAVIKAIGDLRFAICDSKNEKRKMKDLVLVTGSLYLVGEARTLWKLPEF